MNIHLVAESSHCFIEQIEDLLASDAVSRRPFATNFHQASSMLEILVVMAVLAILMAKHPRGKRRMGRYIRGAIDEDMNLGTLAAKTLITQVFGNTVTERTFVSSIVALWSLIGKTIADNEGPIMVGVAHSDYTAAEIEAWIEQSNSWEEADLVSREISGRKIRRVGVFDESGPSLGTQVLNSGKPVTTKLGWILNAGQTLDLWAYNNGSAALATTAPNVVASGHANLWPR